jgi:peptide chain release factor subunit 1
MRGEAMIKETEIMKEKTFLQKFLNEIPRPSTLAVYGINETIHALTIGALEMLILSEAAEYKEIEYECGCGKKKVFALNKPATCKECCQPTRLISQRDAEEVIEELSQNFGTKFQLVSADTREGQQFLALGGIGGFLRYRL